MRSVLAWTTFVTMLAAGVKTAAPEQTFRPGEMTKAEVWVRNNSGESVPVDLRDVHLDSPLRVFVTNGDQSTSVPPLRVRVVTPSWDYRTVSIKNSDDAGAALTRLGAEGWETTGLGWPNNEGTLLLLKRQR